MDEHVTRMPQVKKATDRNTGAGFPRFHVPPFNHVEFDDDVCTSGNHVIGKPYIQMLASKSQRL